MQEAHLKSRVRKIGLCLVLGAAIALPSPLCALSMGGAEGFSLTAGDVCQILGGAAALGFGVWHFMVPDLYRWWSYVPDAPQTLVEAVEATNFFFSLTLSLVGAVNVAMPLLADSAAPAGRLWLWTNVGLWTTRLAYQLIKPQGSHEPALRWGMTAAFTLIDALFLFAALEASLRT